MNTVNAKLKAECLRIIIFCNAEEWHVNNSHLKINNRGLKGTLGHS